MLVVGWQMWGHAGMLARNRDIIGYLELPVAPGAYAVSVLSALTGLIFLVAAVRQLLGHSISRGTRSETARPE
jgi:hypothetical protein